MRRKTNAGTCCGDCRTHLLTALEEAHAAYYTKEIFGGPSLYFHVQSLEAARAQDLHRFAECAYAMLASWGMHRMGPGGSKMREFDEFQTALKTVWPLAIQLAGKSPSTLTDADWSIIEGIFRGLRCMASGTSLVANSKVMAHLLPYLVAPMDREYTLSFLFRNKQITNDMEREWKMLKQMLQGFFYPVIQDQIFQAKADEWSAQHNRFKWDTSPLKIADNLIIGLLTIRRAEKKAAKLSAATAG